MWLKQLEFGLYIFYNKLDLQLITASARKLVNFHLIFQVPAAAMKSRMGIGRKFLLHFVANSILGKVPKAFLKLPSGLGAAVKRSVWGGYFYTPPPYWQHEG